MSAPQIACALRDEGCLPRVPGSLPLRTRPERAGGQARTPAWSGTSGSAGAFPPSVLQIWSPALADIIGARRPWTVAMISLVSMPEVDRGGAEVRVGELALDDVQRHAFSRELDAVGVAQLVRREASPHAGLPALRAAARDRCRSGSRRVASPR
jgi:hypothetical protein